MKEEAAEILKRLSLDELIDILMKNTNELVDMIHKEYKIELAAKKQQIQLIHTVIVAKRAKHKPGTSLL